MSNSVLIAAGLIRPSVPTVQRYDNRGRAIPFKA